MKINDKLSCNMYVRANLDTAQWEILGIFGSLENPDIIQILACPKKVDFLKFGAFFGDFGAEVLTF